MDVVASLPAFVVAVLLISASPGPAMALIFRRAALRPAPCWSVSGPVSPSTDDDPPGHAGGVPTGPRWLSAACWMRST